MIVMQRTYDTMEDVQKSRSQTLNKHISFILDIEPSLEIVIGKEAFNSYVHVVYISTHKMVPDQVILSSTKLTEGGFSDI